MKMLGILPLNAFFSLLKISIGKLNPGSKYLRSEVFMKYARWSLMMILFLVICSNIACNEEDSSSLSSDGYPYCSAAAIESEQKGWAWEHNRSCRIPPACSNSSTDPDGDGWGWENNQSCLIWPSCADDSTDPDGDGWGWENQQSCRSNSGKSSIPTQNHGSRLSVNPGDFLEFETTYYPYRNEHYFRTTCGDANNHGGIYFAVTEASPLWSGSCDNDSWAPCESEDCLSKWDAMPDDVKRLIKGKKKVREPRCDIPCGRRFALSSIDLKIQTTAVIYDACPAQHWNNRYKEKMEGRNPCSKGSLHVDLRKPLYLKLNNGRENGNIKVLINTQAISARSKRTSSASLRTAK